MSHRGAPGGRSPGLILRAMAGYDDDLRFAHVLADVADDITSRRFRALDLRVEAKPDLTPVTDADHACEDSLRNVLRRSRPRDAVLGEEFGRVGSGPRCWVIDPIDATMNYVRGVPVWATLIGLMDGDEVVVGVGDRREVGLGLDMQVERPEPARGDVVRHVREDMGESQVVVITRHGAQRYRLDACQRDVDPGDNPRNSCGADAPFPRHGALALPARGDRPKPLVTTPPPRRGCAATAAANPAGPPAADRRPGRAPSHPARSPADRDRSRTGTRPCPGPGR